MIDLKIWRRAENDPVHSNTGRSWRVARPTMTHGVPGSARFARMPFPPRQSLKLLLINLRVEPLGKRYQSPLEVPYQGGQPKLAQGGKI
jgi:hypothetical protein